MRVPSYARPSHPRRFHRTRRQFVQWVSTLPFSPRAVYHSFVSSITRRVFTMRNTALETSPGTPAPPADPVSPRYRIQAIERAVGILNAFTVNEPELGVTELAEKVGLHKSTVHRFMVNLDAAGLVERNPRTGRYRLGLHIFELGGLVMQQMNLWDEALPFLEGLVRDTGETGHLAVLDGGRRSTSSASRRAGRCVFPPPSDVVIRRTRPISARSCWPTCHASASPRSSPRRASRPTRPTRSPTRSGSRPSSSGSANVVMRSTTRSTTRACAASAPASATTAGTSSRPSGSGGR